MDEQEWLGLEYEGLRRHGLSLAVEGLDHYRHVRSLAGEYDHDAYARFWEWFTASTEGEERESRLWLLAMGSLQVGAYLLMVLRETGSDPEVLLNVARRLNEEA